MEYKLKQAEAADMCQSIISVIVGKYIDRIVEAKSVIRTVIFVVVFITD